MARGTRRTPPSEPISVFSSCVSTIAYDEEMSELIVEYSNGRTYHYDGVTPDVARNVINAPSVGEALARSVKGKFGYRKRGE